MRILISIVVIALAGIRIWKPELAIDEITVALILIAFLPWAGSIFKTIELPGGLKVEYPDLKKIEKQAENSGLIKHGRDGAPSKSYTFEKVSDTDPNLALAGLRIEIESRLQKMASYYAIPQRYSIRKLIEELQKHEALKPAEVSVLMDLLPLLNRAVHGAKVEKEACDLALDMGKDILATLEKREGSPTILQLIERWKNRDGAEFLEVGVELSKSFVKTPAAFLDAMHANPNVLKEWLENIGTNTFTLFESQDSLDDELYTSYYEKLKTLMEKTAQEYAGSEFKKEAMLILEALHKVKIRPID